MRIGSFRQPHAGFRRVNTQGLDSFTSEQGIDESVSASQVEDAADLPGTKFLDDWRYEVIVRWIVSRI